MKGFTFFLVFMVAGIIDVFSQGNYSDNKLIIKFKADSPQYLEWKHISRTHGIAHLEPLLGANSSKPYVSDNLLKALYKNSANPKRYSLPQSVNSYQSKLRSLERIAVVEYSAKISPIVAAAKVSSLPWVEYAEPEWKREYCDATNDSLLSLQYHLPLIKAFQAWGFVPSKAEVLVGIVDSGVDYEHVDLSGNIWSNPGETGTDNEGKDMRSNGVDDDQNGYIDDWRGWDLVSSDSLGYDNDPMPGHSHGTHVAGITAAVQNNLYGIAGVAKNVMIIPVKVGGDSPWSSSIYNGYQGILYAAAAGADVINCSWGGSGYSAAEQEIITVAIASGSVIVCAAGNSYSDMIFYPSAYNGIMSVVSTDQNDKKSGFSNYHLTNDVSAPGSNIISTVPGNTYEEMSGTSMASPCAAGVAALTRLVHPELSPEQVVEWVKASADDIDTLNTKYARKMGRGRVNAFRAMSLKDAYSVTLVKYSITDSNKDSAFDAGELISIYPVFRNVLSPLANGKVIVESVGNYKVDFLKKEISLGSMDSYAEAELPGGVSFYVPATMPVDYTMPVEFRVYDGDTYINSLYIEMVLRPSYRTMSRNNISVTFNSRGNIAFNDYPTNRQGIGFRYMDSKSVLFEGALMIGANGGKVSNVARSSFQSGQDKSFKAFDVFSLSDVNDNILKGSAYFEDDKDVETNPVVSVSQSVFQSNDKGYEDIIFLNYKIVNKSGIDYDSLFAGLFFDWDIGQSGRPNVTFFDEADSIGYNVNTSDTSLPKVGAILLTNQPINFFAIDNDGETDDNPGIYDGYRAEEKWLMLSNGIKRRVSDTTDASMVIGGGPINMKNDDSVIVSFALLASFGEAGIAKAAKTARSVFATLGASDKAQVANGSIAVYPNPAGNNFNISFSLTGNSNVSISLLDLSGREITKIAGGKVYEQGSHTISVPSHDIAPGLYFVRFHDGNNSIIKAVSIYR